MGSREDRNVCLFCDSALESHWTVQLTAKGVKGILNAANLRNDAVTVKERDTVHISCRHSYTNLKTIARDKRLSPQSSHRGQKRTLRSTVPEFQFQSHCIVCGQERKFLNRSKKYNVICVRTGKQFQDTIKQVSAERNDDWGATVLGRLEYATDCCATGVIYHQTCSVNFRTKKQPPTYMTLETEPTCKSRKLGRPEDLVKLEAFNYIIAYLEANRDEQLTLSHLVEVMEEYVSKDAAEPYAKFYLKKKLVEHYGENIVIAEIEGKSDVITFKHTASAILREYFHTAREDDEKSQKKIVKIAAQLIKCSMRDSTFPKDVYPSADIVASLNENLSFVDGLLCNFLENIICPNKSKLKIASIGQAIMQTSMSRSILAPLQIGLGIYVHHHFASRLLVDTLFRLGFCTSYNEVQRFQANAAICSPIDTLAPESDQFIQFVADNVDHNIRTIDGLGTFHGMGIIAAITPVKSRRIIIPRSSPSLADILKVGKINISHFSRQLSASNMYYPQIENVELSANDSTDHLDLLWKVSQPFSKAIPSWPGVMQSVMRSNNPATTDIVFLPLIDMDPSNPTCIYSTLNFVSEQAEKQNSTPILTFDQPLFWKASCIIKNENSNSKLKSVILKLGPFHTEMSFVSCVGHLMAGTGLEDVLELIYARNTVTHMLTGKAITRAVRGHFLVQSALYATILTQSFAPYTVDVNVRHSHEAERSKMSLNCQDTPATSKEPGTNEEICLCVNLLQNLLKGEQSQETVLENECFSRVRNKIETLCKSLTGKRTCDLWLQYIYMIDILQKFLKAERTGNFLLHLDSLSCMMPFFAASGHNNYTKSVSIYLKNMKNLQTSNSRL